MHSSKMLFKTRTRYAAFTIRTTREWIKRSSPVADRFCKGPKPRSDGRGVREKRQTRTRSLLLALRRPHTNNQRDIPGIPVGRRAPEKRVVRNRPQQSSRVAFGRWVFVRCVLCIASVMCSRLRDE